MWDFYLSYKISLEFVIFSVYRERRNEVSEIKVIFVRLFIMPQLLGTDRDTGFNI